MTDQTDYHRGEPEHTHAYRIILDQEDAPDALVLHEWEAKCDPTGESMTALIDALRKVADMIECGHKDYLNRRN